MRGHRPIGHWPYDKRVAAGVPREELAWFAGVSGALLYRIEAGRSARPGRPWPCSRRFSAASPVGPSVVEEPDG